MKIKLKPTMITILLLIGVNLICVSLLFSFGVTKFVSFIFVFLNLVALLLMVEEE